MVFVALQTPHHNRFEVAEKLRDIQRVVVIDSGGVAQVSAGVAQTIVGKQEQVGWQQGVHEAVGTSIGFGAVARTCSRTFLTT